MIGIRRTRSAAPLRSGTGGVFRQKRKYYPKDGAIFLLFVVVSGERTMLHTGAEQREENRYYTVVLVHTHTSALRSHTLASRSVGRCCEECARRGGNGAPLAMVVDLYCGGVVVGSSPSSSSTTIFRFRPPKQQSINTRHDASPPWLVSRALRPSSTRTNGL